MEEGTPRIMLLMVDEGTADNLFLARDNMEKEHRLKPENMSDVIAILLNYWFRGKREYP